MQACSWRTVSELPTHAGVQTQDGLVLLSRRGVNRELEGEARPECVTPFGPAGGRGQRMWSLGSPKHPVSVG